MKHKITFSDIAGLLCIAFCMCFEGIVNTLLAAL